MTDLNQLLPGDVLVFEGDRDPAHKGQWVDQLIMDLTHSSVTHGAICLGPEGLVDANIGGIANHAIAAGSSQTVHVRRLVGGLDMAPVLTASQRYVAEHDNYDWAGLVMTGLILIYRNCSTAGPVQRLMTVLFERLALRFTDWINQELAKSGKYDPGPHPMFCSEFVYQCFEDAGEPYVLQLRHGDILLAAGGRGGLLDRLMVHPDSLKAGAIPQMEGDLAGLSDQDLARALCGAMRSDTNSPEAGLDPALLEAVRKFEVAWMRMVTRDSVASPSCAFAFLESRRSVFVTPNDLLVHCENLEDQGTVTLDRGNDPLPPQPFKA